MENRAFIITVVHVELIALKCEAESKVSTVWIIWHQKLLLSRVYICFYGSICIRYMGSVCNVQLSSFGCLVCQKYRPNGATKKKGNRGSHVFFFFPHHHLEFFDSPLMLKKLIVGKEITTCKSSFYNKRKKKKRMVKRLGWNFHSSLKCHGVSRQIFPQPWHVRSQGWCLSSEQMCVWIIW